MHKIVVAFLRRAHYIQISCKTGRSLPSQVTTRLSHKFLWFRKNGSFVYVHHCIYYVSCMSEVTAILTGPLCVDKLPTSNVANETNKRVRLS